MDFSLSDDEDYETSSPLPTTRTTKTSRTSRTSKFGKRSTLSRRSDRDDYEALTRTSDSEMEEKVYLIVNKDLPFYENYWDRASKRLQDKAGQFLTALWAHKFLITAYVIIMAVVIVLVYFQSTWSHLDWQGVVALAVLFGECAFLISNKVPASLVFLTGLCVFYLSGILTSQEAFVGFSDPGVVLAASTFVITKVLELSNVYKYLFEYVFRQPKAIRPALAVVLPIMAIMSAFVNESTVVGTLTRTMVVWAQRCKLPVQQILMPMLLAVLLGSTMTLLGCSTNILISGLAQNRDPELHFPTFQMSYVSLPLCFMGVLYMILYAPMLLPQVLIPRKEREKAIATERLFCARVRVAKTAPFLGQTYGEAGLEVPGAIIVQIESEGGYTKYSAMNQFDPGDSDAEGLDGYGWDKEGEEEKGKGEESPLRNSNRLSGSKRNNSFYTARKRRIRSTTVGSWAMDHPTPSSSRRFKKHFAMSSIEEARIVRQEEGPPASMTSQRVEEGDIIWVCASLGPLMILFRIDGLLVASEQINYVTGSRTQRRLVEAVVSPTSLLTAIEVTHHNFRRTYDACIIAIFRAGGCYFACDEKPLSLKPGDVLLLETVATAAKEMALRREFSLVVTFMKEGISKRGHGILGVLLTCGLFVSVLVLSSLEIWTLTQGFLFLVIVFGFFQLITYKQMLGALQNDVLLTMAASFATEAALTKTGAALVIGQSLFYICRPFGQLGVYTIVYVMTFIVTQFMTNSATGSLMFSIAYQLGTTSGSNLKGVIYVLMFACSASFLTPVGYTSNMVMAKKGSYKQYDFIRFGAPLAILDMIVVLFMHMLIYPPEES